MVLIGNLGIVRMLYQGFQQVAAPGGNIDKASIFQRVVWTIEGFFMVLVGKMHLPYGLGNWYWDPSRILPSQSGDPITEFPLFTFIYSDLHAHMIALMITVLAIAWALSVLLARARWKNHLDTATGLLLGGLVIGALKPTNTWDFYTYLILGAVVLAYSVWRYADVSRLPLSASGVGQTSITDWRCSRGVDWRITPVLPAFYTLVPARPNLHENVSSGRAGVRTSPPILPTGVYSCSSSLPG